MEFRLSCLVLLTASFLASAAGQVLYTTTSAPGPPNATTVCEQSFLIDAVADTDGYIALNGFRNTTCGYRISAPQGYHVYFELEHLSMEWPVYYTCKYDYLTLYDGVDVTAPEVVTVCGSLYSLPRRTAISAGNAAFVQAKADSSSASFRLRYRPIPQVCGGDFTTGDSGPPIFFPTPPGISAAGVLSSFNGSFYQAVYPNNMDCTWTLTADEGERIGVYFSNVQFEKCGGYDYVEVFDGIDPENSPRLAKLCGYNTTGPIVTSGNEVSFRMKTDASVQERGFQAYWGAFNSSIGNPFSTPSPTSYPHYSSSTYFPWSTPPPPSPDCGGVLTNSSGEVISPSFPVYPSYTNCYWYINAPYGQRVTVDFSFFHVEAPCYYDSVKFYDGNSTSDSLIAELCGPVTPGPLRSFSENLLVVFTSDSIVNHVGFKFDYEFVGSGFLGDIDGCGGLYTSDNGEITSVDFPGGLPEGNWHCEYKITAPLGQAVAVVFNLFDLRPNPGCTSQSLKFYDGNSTSAPLMARRCGSSSFVEVRNSTGESLLVVFDSNSYYSNGSRFSLAYRFIEPSNFTNGQSSTYPPFTTTTTTASTTTACGGVYDHNNGTIRSPNFPNHYHNHAHCEYTITAYTDHVVRVTFTTFNVEPHPACNYDSVKIYDGSSTSSPLIANDCGSSIPGPYISTSENITIVFDADHIVTRTGFSLNYVFVVPSNDTDDYSTTGSTTTTTTAPTGPGPYECGAYFQTITTNSSVVVSPNYPSSYSNYGNCQLQIRAPAGYQVVVTFTHFNVEGGGSCPYDRLRIYDGSTASGDQIERLCGYPLPSPAAVQRSTGRDMTLHFTTDGSVTRAGWRAVVTFEVPVTVPPPVQGATTECGIYSGTITNPGFVTSPNYPSSYFNSENCQLHIAAPQGYGVVLTFSNFNVEASGYCPYDRLYIYDSLNNSGTRLARLCGPVLPSPSVYRSTDRYMTLQFTTDSSVTRSGWKAEVAWEALTNTTSTPTPAPIPVLSCGTVSTASTARLISPNFPNNYPPNLNCTFTISRPPGDRISLTFSDFDLEFDSNCADDYVAVYDGPSVNPGVLMGQVCGSSIPFPFYTTGNEMVVHFRTNGNSTVGSGFNATYEIF